jgi:protein-disulfide isomerase
MTSLPRRASRDLKNLVRTPAALASAAAFVAVAAAAVALFPGAEVAAAPADSSSTATQAAPAAAIPQAAMQQLEEYLAQQTRITVPGVGGTGAAVVLVKFNDYQCPPCGMTYRDYKPVLARLQKEHPGKIAFITKDFPLDPECNSLGGGHMAACEAAAGVRLAREKGRADTLEDWLFANQPTLTPERVKEAVSTVGGVSDFDARYAKTLELVRADIAHGLQVGVSGTPTFFMNGMRLPNLRSEFFEAAVLWELRRVAK